MSWRIVVIANRAKLDFRMEYMVVRGENTTKIHLSEISVLVIESTEVSLTVALLAALVTHKIKIIFCDEKRNPCSELLAYYGSHDTSAKIKQQINWKEQIKGDVWTAIVHEKITNQSRLLALSGKAEHFLIQEYISQLQYRDSTNREGHSAKVYFNALFGMQFTRSQDNFINAALNYGYTILLAACNREIVSNGYLTQLGLCHENMFNMFNLGSDFMEPLRPFFDRIVYDMWVKNSLNEFSTEQKLRLLDILNQEVIIGGKKQVLNNGIKLYCRSLFDALNSQDISSIQWCYFIGEKE